MAVRVLKWVGGVFVVLVAGLLFWPVDIEPLAYDPGIDPMGTGVYMPNEDIGASRFVEIGPGPEGVEIGKDGLIYTGLADGRIVRIEANGDVTELANTGGRPLGIEFDAKGNLIIADAFKGLLSMAPNGRLKVLTTDVNGKRMIFVDDLAIGKDGKIWFSDASQRFDLHRNLDDLIENHPTGRLVSYNPKTGETSVELGNLHFANGIALSADGSFVLVNETFTNRIKRYWLKGAKIGQVDIFADQLPGFPDNITLAPDGGFWVALAAPRDANVDAMADKPFRRKIFYRAMKLGLISPGNLGVANVIKFNAKGKAVAFHQDTSGKLPVSTSALEHRGKLYIGSLVGQSIAVMDLN